MADFVGDKDSDLVSFTAGKLAGLYCIPADNDNIYGWSPPTEYLGSPINGGKGSPAYYGILGDVNPVVEDGTNRTAGVVSPLMKSGVGMSSRVIRGVRADVGGIPDHGPTMAGNSNVPSDYSSMGRALLEWVSKGNKYVVTYFDTIRVNGVDKGKTHGSGWAVEGFHTQGLSGGG
jgi:hypothetical protein